MFEIRMLRSLILVNSYQIHFGFRDISCHEESVPSTLYKKATLRVLQESIKYHCWRIFISSTALLTTSLRPNDSIMALSLFIYQDLAVFYPKSFQ